MYKILMIEDDNIIAEAVRRHLVKWGNEVECGGAVLNLSDMSLSYEGGRRELSKNEFRILQLLFEHAGQTVIRESIMKRLWDNECFVDDNTLTVNINRLRRTLKEIGLEDFIRTRKGVGYQLDAGRRDDMSYVLYLAVILGLLAGIRGCICQIRILRNFWTPGNGKGRRGHIFRLPAPWRNSAAMT